MWKCRWKTSCPAILPLFWVMFIPSALKAFLTALLTFTSAFHMYSISEAL